MANLDLTFTPLQSPHPSGLDIAIVIDVLRMTTNAAALFGAGLDELLVVADVEDAREVAAKEHALLLGERGGVPLEGFDGGNSPREHVEADLTGKRAVLCTSNGSFAVGAVAAAQHVLLGSIVNARAVARRATELAAGDPAATVTLVCAGTDRRASLDDTLGAGLIAREMKTLDPQTTLTDAANMALLLALRPEPVETALSRSSHASTLASIGMSKDIVFAAQLNILDVAPERVRSADAQAASVSTRFRLPT